LKPTKLASMRPLGEQNAASRASFRPSKAKSWVSWPCRNLAESAPCARITPQWGRGKAPSKGGKADAAAVLALWGALVVDVGAVVTVGAVCSGMRPIMIRRSWVYSYKGCF
jgi:hypothetical protein